MSVSFVEAPTGLFWPHALADANLYYYHY